MSNQADTCLGIAVFGVGRAGSIHLGNLMRNRKAKVLYLLDEDTARAHDAVTFYRMAESITVLKPQQQDQALQDSRVDGVFVCSPTITHEAIVMNALKHGKGVFCEKPLSLTIDGIISCYEEAERVDKPLLCALNRRFDPSVSGIHDRTQAGELGKLHVVKVCSRDPTPKSSLIEYFKISGGIFHDCMIHDIDIVCWLLKEYPVSVYSQGHAHDAELANISDIDTAIIVMKFASGAMAVIDVSREAVYGHDQRVEVFGSGGMLLSTNQQPDGIVSHSKSGVTSSCFKADCVERYGESYIRIDDHFLDVLSGVKESIYTKTQISSISIVASACQKSYQTGQPVPLTWT